MLAELKSAHGQLRTLAHGIHPAVLTQQGLAAGLESLAEQASLPVTVVAPAFRYPPVIEATAYFIVSEALTNVGKHSHATQATVTLHRRHDRLMIEVVDDGVGGAEARRGSGLTGLSDRAAALGGRMSIDSPWGHGTRLRIELPCVWSYARALERFLGEEPDDAITARLDEVYATEGSALDSAVAAAQRRAVAEPW